MVKVISIGGYKTVFAFGRAQAPALFATTFAEHLSYRSLVSFVSDNHPLVNERQQARHIHTVLPVDHLPLPACCLVRRH